MIYVSHFPAQRLACPGAHYHAHAHICATLDGHPFGTKYLVITSTGRRMVLVKRDICGRHRIDVPTGTFRDLFGAAGMKQGIVPVRYRVVGHISVRHHRK